MRFPKKTFKICLPRLTCIGAMVTGIAYLAACSSTHTHSPSSDLRDSLAAKPPATLPQLLRLGEAPSGVSTRGLTGIKVIDVKIARAFPHLASFGGNLVIFSKTMHVVLPGRSLEAVRGAWNPLIAAVFQFDSGRWQLVPALSDIQISLTSQSDARFAGIDIDDDSKQVGAAIMFESNGQRFGVGVVVDPEQNILAIGEFRPRSTGNSSSQQATLIRFDPGQSSVWQPFEGRQVADSFQQIAMDSTAAAAIFGGRNSRQYSGAAILSATPYLTVVVGRSESAAAQLLPDIAADCAKFSSLSTSLKQLLRRFSAVNDCKMTQLSQRTALTQVEIPDDQTDGAASLARPILVSNAVTKKPLLRALARAGEVLHLRIPFGGRSTISDGFDLNLDADLDLSTSDSNQTVQAFLPQRSWGEVEFIPRRTGSDPFEEPAILRIQLQNKGFANIFDLDLADHPRVANGFLIKRWPTTIELPEGTYRISIVHEATKSGCVQQIEVEEGVLTDVLCAMTPLSSRPPLEIVRMIEGQTGDEDFNDEWRSATGANILNLPLTSDGLSSELAETSSFDGNTSQSFSVTAPLTRISVRAFPVSRAFVQRWLQYWEKHSDLDILTTFTRFTRQFAPDALIELGCPGLEQSVTHYIRVFDQVEPDLVRYYSCPMVKNHPRLASKVLSQLLERVTMPPPLTFDASSNAQTPVTPALELTRSLPKEPGSEGLARRFAELMRNGNYRFSQGASALRVAESDAAQNPVLVTEAGSGSVVSDQLRIQLGLSVSKLRLIVYSEVGAIGTIDRAIKPTSRELMVDVRANLQGQPKYVRYEVYGFPVEGKSVSEHPVLLAGTNFYPVRFRHK